MNDPALQLDTLASYVGPLIKEQKLFPLPKILVSAGVLVAIAVVSLYSLITIDRTIRHSLTSQRMNDLQHQYDKLISLVTAAEPASIVSLREQLEATQKEL